MHALGVPPRTTSACHRRSPHALKFSGATEETLAPNGCSIVLKPI